MTPVYAIEPHGPPSVPTGLVFVRFRENVDVQQRRRALTRAGYEVTEILPYAPQAAWVRAIEQGIAASLTRIPALEVLPDIVSVEPQMLSERKIR